MTIKPIVVVVCECGKKIKIQKYKDLKRCYSCLRRDRIKSDSDERGYKKCESCGVTLKADKYRKNGLCYSCSGVKSILRKNRYYRDIGKLEEIRTIDEELSLKKEDLKYCFVCSKNVKCKCDDEKGINNKCFKNFEREKYPCSRFKEDANDKNKKKLLYHICSPECEAKTRLFVVDRELFSTEENQFGNQYLKSKLDKETEELYCLGNVSKSEESDDVLICELKVIPHGIFDTLVEIKQFKESKSRYATNKPRRNELVLTYIYE